MPLTEFELETILEEIDLFPEEKKEEMRARTEPPAPPLSPHTKPKREKKWGWIAACCAAFFCGLACSCVLFFAVESRLSTLEHTLSSLAQEVLEKESIPPTSPQETIELLESAIPNNSV